MDTIKYIKLENEDGTYGNEIPLAVNSDYVSVGSNTLTEELNNKATKTEVQTIASGSPAGIYETATALVNADPNHNKIYLVLEDGYWYYHDGSIWTQGGVYQATGLAEESVEYKYLDTKLTKDLALSFNTIDILGKAGYYYDANGIEHHGSNSSGYATFSMTVSQNEMYKIKLMLNTGYLQPTYPAYMFKQNDTLIKKVAIEDVVRDSENYYTDIITIPEGVNTFQFQVSWPMRGYCIKVDKYTPMNITKQQLNDNLQDIFSDNYEEITLNTLIPNAYFKGGYSFDSYNTADTYYVDVNPGDKFKITVNQLYVQPILAFCTNHFKSSVTVNGITYDNIYRQNELVQSETANYKWVNYEFIIPEYCNKLYINKGKGDSTFSLKKSVSYSVSVDSIDFEQLKADLNPLNNKRIAFLGDSITAASTAGYKGWPVLIQENNPTAIVYNIAHDGATIADNGQTYSVYQQIQKVYNNYPDVDYIIIQGGVNDLWQSIPLGEYIENSNFNGETAYDISTFSGGLEWIFHYCYTHFPERKIGYIVTQKVIYTNGFYNFMNRAKDICNKWSIPYVDLYNEGNLNFYITSQKENYSRDKQIASGDGCHPNLAGYQILTPKIENWLKYKI